jgi:DNA-binding NarL/FixJ family response regulator
MIKDHAHKIAGVAQKTVLIVDDHPMFREGIKAIVESNGTFEVAGEAGTAVDGLKMAEQLQPDLMVLDISLPDESGIALAKKMQQLPLETRIMFVSMHSTIHYISEAFKAGARGYVAKQSASENLLDGLRDIAKGGYFLDASISSTVIENIINKPIKTTPNADIDRKDLTRRELEIMKLLARGFSNQEIATKLSISSKTVSNHRANILKKLDIHSNLELVRYAAKLGLIDVERWRVL